MSKKIISISAALLLLLAVVIISEPANAPVASLETESNIKTCTDKNPIDLKNINSDSQLKPLESFQNLCDSFVSSRKMTFIGMPTSTKSAKQLALHISDRLKEFSDFNITPVVIVEPFHEGVMLDSNNTGVSQKESYKLGELLSVASADPAMLECPDANYLSPDRGGVAIDVLKLKDGKCYPSKQFENSSSPDMCTEVHYHTQLTSLGGNVRNDSQPCGAAVKSDILKIGPIYVQPTAR